MIIKEIKINNYKSLVDFELKDLDKTTIIYGDNNAGKSNVLEFISVVFKRKKQLDDFELFELTDEPVHFYSGILEDFNYSFFKNETENEIEFEINVLSNSKKSGLDTTTFQNLLNCSIDDEIEYKFIGTIENYEKNYAFFDIKLVEVNNCIVYENKIKSINYFPDKDPDKNDQSLYRNYFEHILEPFEDCVFFIQSHRDMLPTKFGSEFENSISPLKFKKFLYSLSLNEEEYSTFEKINRLFSETPFSYGNISFSKIDDTLEIMIQKNDIRLPIKSLGSGVLQVLYIITCIIYSRKSIICLEELEQNLSPKNQELAIEKLISLLKDDEVPNQLIISSHSPYFYQNKSIKSSFLIEKKDGKTIKVARNGNYPPNEDDIDEKEISLFEDHFKGHEDFY